MNIVINGNAYKVVKTMEDAIQEEVLAEKITDYFEKFDFIVGDWAYGKLRLKGFYKSDSSLVSVMNDIKYLDTYLETKCAYGCKWFLIERIK